MAIIRTILGDLNPADLGICLAHEHVYGQPPVPYAEAEPDHILNDEAAVTAELQAYLAAGGRSLVEMTTPDYGRNAAAMLRIARASGVQLIAATGHNKEKFSAPFLEDTIVDALADRFVREVTVGMDGTDARAGVIKAASMLNEMSRLTRRLFRAAAQAHQRTGAPIFTHTEAGTMALDQVEILSQAGVSPAHIVIGHVDRNPDFDVHLNLAASGVYLSYDQIGKARYAPDSHRADFAVRLIAAGYGKQLVLAGDTARRSGWSQHGGTGFTHILQTFVPMLRERGVSQAAIDDLLIHNPASALTFTPVGEVL